MILKKKLSWLKDALMSLLFLAVFCLFRLVLISQSGNFHVNDETIAILLAGALVVLMVLTHITGKLKNSISFAFDVFLLALMGYFLWDLGRVEQQIEIGVLLTFALLLITGVITALKSFKVDRPSLVDGNELVELHDFFNKGLAAKTSAMVFGILLIEILLVPIVT